MIVLRYIASVAADWWTARWDDLDYWDRRREL